MGSEQSAQQKSKARSSTVNDPKARGDSATADKTRGRSLSIDSNCPQAPDYIQSGLSKPISSSQHSGSSESLKHPQVKRSFPKEIIIVSKGDDGEEDQQFTFPPPFKPLIPIGHETLPQGCLQLNPAIVSNIGLLLEEQLKSRAEFVHNQQGVLTELIRELDFVTSFLTTNILNERQKRLSKVTENFNRFTDINKSLDKIEADLDICLARIDCLNNALPIESRLEKFTGSLVSGLSNNASKS